MHCREEKLNQISVLLTARFSSFFGELAGLLAVVLGTGSSTAMRKHKQFTELTWHAVKEVHISRAREICRVCLHKHFRSKRGIAALQHKLHLYMLGDHDTLHGHAACGRMWLLSKIDAAHTVQARPSTHVASAQTVRALPLLVAMAKCASGGCQRCRSTPKRTWVASLCSWQR